MARALRAEGIVTAYYAASVFISVILLQRVHGMGHASTWDLLWPLAWADGLDMALVTELLGLAAVFASLAAVQFRHLWQVRAVFAIVFLLAATIVNSGGAIDHPYHGWLWVGIVFVFLPNGRVVALSRVGKLSYLTVFVSAQLLFMLFYTLAGFWKFGFGIAALITGDPGSFSFEALSWTIADRSLQTGTSPLLAEMIIFYPVIAWPAYIAVIYLQLFALLAVLRPRLTVFWGYALIGFHLGTWVLMEILFVEHVLLLVLLMALSPFAPERFRLAEFIRDLPILGRLTRIGAAVSDKGKTSLTEARH